MALKLYAHPFSSYCQKALIAFYENDIPFNYCVLSPENPSGVAELKQLWPINRFPVLLDGDKAVIEATIIVEHLDLRYPGRVRFMPQDPEAALDVRFMDRFFDNYVHTPMQKIVADRIREESQRDAKGVADARSTLDTAYGWLNQRMAGREWASGDSFSLADCAAAPALFYADWSHRITDAHPNVLAYRKRLNARPSFARAIDEARPYRSFFPLGAPDRD